MSFALTGAIVMGGLTAFSISEQNKAIENQQESINATTKMNYALKQQQEQELKAQAGMEKTQESIKRFQERGKIQAAQAESGVAGVSPLRELANSYLQESLTQGSITATAEAKQRSLALENQSTYLQGLSQWNQLESNKTTGFDAALQIGMSAGAGALTGGALGASSAAAAGAGTGASTSLGNTLMSQGGMMSIGAPVTTTAATSTGLIGGMSASQQLALASILGSYSKR